MKKTGILTVLLIGFNLQAQQIKWLGLEEALAMSKKNPKKILIDVYTDWCGWCKRMDRRTYENKTIVNYINKHFYAVKFNAEQKKAITYLGKTYKQVRSGRNKYHELAAYLLAGQLSYPSTLFMDANGSLITRIPGYQNPENMETILAYFSGDAYKTTDWKAFEKNFKSKL